MKIYPCDGAREAGRVARHRAEGAAAREAAETETKKNRRLPDAAGGGTPLTAQHPVFALGWSTLLTKRQPGHIG
ncbi:hypothetical protein ACIA8I_19515 [Streptomyces rishiriensis]|uniref:hypothetical protein n=1 Tax=Streptomyces rishiriensis TaxID=68264 RepID=UPI00378BD608